MLSKTVTGLCLDDAGTLWGVEVASSLRGVTVRRAGRWAPSSDLPAGDPLTGWAPLIAQARAEGFGASGAVVVGLPSGQTFQKRLSFPFHGRPRLAQVVRPALEGEIPVPLDHVEADFLVLPGGGGASRGAEVLAIACPRAAADAIRGSFPAAERGGAPTVLLQTDALGLAAASRELGVAEGAAVSLHGSSATLVGLQGGQVTGVRRVRAFSPEELPGRVIPALAEWGMEGKELLLAGASWDRLALRAALKEAGVARVLEGEDAAALRAAGVEDPGPYLPAFGLALAGLGRGAAPFNLLKPRQGTERGWGWTAPRIRLAALGGLAAVLALTAFTTDYLAAKKEFERESSRLRTAFSTLFPGQKAVNETAQLREKIRTLTQRVEDLTAGSGAASDPLAVMGELSRLVPPEMDLKLEELAVESGRLRVDASLPGFDTIDQLKAAMESSPLFSGVRVQNARVGATAGRVTFRLQAEVK